MATIKYKNENGQWQEIATGGGGGTVEVDMEMSDTSENAVANRVIKEYVDALIPSEYSDEFNNDFTI